MTEENIIIIGGIGTAHNIIEQIIDAKGNHAVDIQLKGIIIDSFEKGTLISGIPVLGGKEDIPTFLKDESIKFIYALFKQEKMKERYDLMESLNIPEEKYINFIHPLSYKAGSVILGTGNVILSNSTIQSNVILGNYNIINSNITIEHDTIIGNGNFLAANSCVGSNVKIGNHCFIGLNSSIRENVKIGNNLFVGMHSLVLNDFADCKIAGIPAHKTKNNNTI